ncbi:Csu type fimbrial protein [Cupriavidus cauae]|nr:spore coat protein U domain-containing protein [Cupriavidus cauae]
MNMHRIARLTLAALLLALASAAQGQTCTATASNLTFGTVSPVSGAASTANGSISINCTGFALGRARVCLGIGTGSGGTALLPRTLSSGSGALNYNLYTNSGYTTVWGPRGGSGTSYVQIDIPMTLGTGQATVPVYGQVPANQSTVRAGAYQSAFTAAFTEMNYAEYVLVAPNCATLTSPVARFPFTVTANVISDCIITATNVDFGTRGLLSADATATGTITARCTNGSPYTLAINAGTSAGASVANRRMQRSGGTEQIGYQLYQNAAYSVPWGDGTTGTSVLSATGTGATQSYTVYGRVPAQQTPVAGTYADTVTVTVTY